MNKMIQILNEKIFFLVLLFSNNLYSQTKFSGQILSSTDSQPITGASVYFDGTSIGVATDIDGLFSITTNNNISSSLIINSLGFKTQIFPNPLKNPNMGIILLEESQESLGVVHIETDTWSRQKKLEIFRKEFLGKTPMAIQCRILNEDVLHLRYIPSTQTLVASADKPLKIINKHLGYEITYNLTDFKVVFSLAHGNQFAEKVYYEGSSFFEELSNEPLPRFLRNRERVFKGSHLHFMRSLATKKLSENGFNIFDAVSELPHYYFQITTVAGRTEVKLLIDKIWIVYGWQKSAIHANGIFYIDHHGNFTPPQNVILSGKMGTYRIAGLLPLNYNL